MTGLWDELLDESSTADARCAACVHWHARAVGRSEIARLLMNAEDHRKLGAEHDIKIEVDL